ncbi:transposable element Tcb2 transposase [Trichonephila clavipes]|nr:transposable element Tcb2 transposase [Trichonephila clavipes]
MANNQSVRRHLDAFTLDRIIGKLEEGRSVTSQKKQAAGRPISRFTVARRLHGGGLFARRPVRCVPLTPAYRRRRSLWCQEHRNWRDNEWGRVLFTDESRFRLSSDSHRILIWRERGSRNHPSNIIERDRYGGRGVLVWGGILLGSRTDLHIFDAGSVNGTRYCNEILLPYVRLFRGAMGLQFSFMDDNAPCHRTVAAEQLLESEDIERMDWPARSPDLNPIEHVWDFLGRRLAACTLPPVTIRELRLALQDEWAAMPQQLIDTLILSMGRRCETCPAAQVAPSLEADVSSSTIRRHLAEGHLGSRGPLRVLPLRPTHRYLRLKWCRARGNWTAVEWNKVVFIDEYRFNLSSDDNRVRVWSPRGERLNPAFSLQRHTTPTTGVMVWGAIAYNTRLPLVLIYGTMVSCNHMCCLSCNESQELFFNKTMIGLPRQGCHKTVPALLLPSFACMIPRFVSIRSYMGSFGTVN